MDLEALGEKFAWLPEPALKALEKIARKVPAIREQIDREGAGVMEALREELKPYGEEALSFRQIPAEGVARARVLDQMERFYEQEKASWEGGFVSGAVYHGDPAFIEFLNRVYAINSQSNPLHADVWPSTTKFEAEIVRMTAGMLGAGETEDEIVGTVSSGGTESILLAVKAYRDWARQARGIRRPNMVIPSTAHAAFDKAAQYFEVRLVSVPVAADCRADVGAMQAAVDGNTILMVGSAPGFPHGVIDPIAELSEFARGRGIGFHTDACLGGFLLPWARQLGYPVPEFDFALPGVTSISVDTHKYGYAAKGSSVVLYRGKDLRHSQYYTTGRWSGGLYASPTFAGSRAGALSAVCWAALVSTGEAGYLEATRRILETGEAIKAGVRAIPELEVLGDPLWVIAFKSDKLDVYRVMDAMGAKGWSLNGLFDPPAVHLAITQRHAQPGVAERFLDDLAEAVRAVKEDPAGEGGMAPVYGMTASTPFKGMVDDFLKLYLDVLYEVD